MSFPAPLPGSSTPTNTPIHKIITADVNKDGKKDIICSNGLVLLGNGDGSFTASSTVAFPYISNQRGPYLASGDLNKDGKVDLVMGTGTTITIWLGNGDGTFNKGTTYASIDNGGGVSVNWISMATAIPTSTLASAMGATFSAIADHSNDLADHLCADG